MEVENNPCGGQVTHRLPGPHGFPLNHDYGRSWVFFSPTTISHKVDPYDLIFQDLRLFNDLSIVESKMAVVQNKGRKCIEKGRSPASYVSLLGGTW